MVNQAEEAIVKTILEQYQLDTTHLIYDATNFFTYIDTMQDSKLAKRGHSKEKRNDLKIVGLSMMITPDCSVPLLHESYPGNRPDSKQFCRIVTEMKQRYERISGKQSDVTIVFDRGNNSIGNIDLLEEGDFPFHYVGGLPKFQAKELYLIPLSEYTPLAKDAFLGQKAYRSNLKVFNREVTAVICYNPSLEEGQMQGLNINREKVAVKLTELQQKLALLEQQIMEDIQNKTGQVAAEKGLDTVITNVEVNVRAMDITDLVIAGLKK
jgi:transposase